MAQKLPSKGLIKNLHIALFFLFFLSGIQLEAQSVLLPGDVVVVSVHADTQAIDIIPLIDIEKGTELFLSDGFWNDSTKTLTGNELKINFRNSIQAGTNIHLNHLDDERFELSGRLRFSGNTNRLFVYQKESGIHRFVFGMSWGENPVWKRNSSESLGSDIPASLKLNKSALLTLGNKQFYQYYVKNGASGTRSMLLRYVGDVSHWRGNDRFVYPAFGTSFKLLDPPVVLFENSISTVTEDDSSTVLNVAIYEHDGSRLTVDVVFDTLNSTLAPNDIFGFNNSRVNFTGLVGDAVYEVKLQVNDDEVFEDRETGFFTLQNLTKGNFGDFLTHGLIMLDNDVPELLISDIQRSRENHSYIQITNEEEIEVSIQGWKISTEKGSVTFEDDYYLAPQESILWIDGNSEVNPTHTKKHFHSGLDKRLLKSGRGVAALLNPSGEMVSEIEYPALDDEEEKVPEESFAAMDSISSTKQEQPSNEIAAIEGKVASGKSPKNSVWKVLTNKITIMNTTEPKAAYTWDKNELKFKPVVASDFEGSDSYVMFGLFDREFAADSVVVDSTQKKQLPSSELLMLEISAMDKNENERIDGLEGLNLAVNQLSNPVSVAKLANKLQSIVVDSEAEPTFYSTHYDTTRGLSFTKLEQNDLIQPGAVFWVWLDDTVEPLSLEIPYTDLLPNDSEAEAEEDLNSEEGVVQIYVESNGHKDFISIEVTDSLRGFSGRDLNSYPNVILPKQTFMNVAFMGGEEFYKTIQVPSSVEQKMSIPVSFSTSESGNVTFHISDFEHIPAGWNIQLEDRLFEKMFDIRKDAEFNFKHIIPENRERSGSDSQSKPEKYIITERFVVHITPAFSETASGEEKIDLPRKLELYQNFPNPFNPVTTISFYLPEPEEIRLSVFNIVGQPVAVITEGSLSAGEHQFEWDATDKPSGMYIYQLDAGKSVMTRKMTLVK